jgi:hypothetical protein
MNTNTNLDPRLKEVVCFVEATTFEELTLWEKHNRGVLWEQDAKQEVINLGEIEDRPTNVCFRFAKLNGTMICFYEGISSLVDYLLIENFLFNNFPEASHTNAMNFHIALERISNLSKSVSTPLILEKNTK